MKSQDIIDILRRNADTLRERGVKHAALFGSLARGEADAQSDIDILIDLDPAIRFDVFSYVGLKLYIEELFPGRVDVVNRAALKPYLREPVAADLIDAF
jgi:predicted nucleotidyltransferase